MKITVDTGSWAAAYVNQRLVSLDLPEASNVADVLDAVGIPQEEAGLAILDGKVISREHSLSEGDSVKIQPMVLGG